MFAFVVAIAVFAIGVRASWSSPCGESMITTVHPLAEGARGRRWVATAVWFVVATLVTSTLLGATLSWLGSMMSVGVGGAVLVSLILVIAAAVDLGGWRPPSTTRQLNENWLTSYRGWVIGAGYGAQLGSGFATVVPSWTGYALIPVLVLAGDPVTGALLGLVFGLGRVAAVAPAGVIRDRSSLARIPDRWVAAEPLAAGVTSVAIVVAGLSGLSATLTSALSLVPVAAAATGVIVAVLLARRSMMRRYSAGSW